MVLNVIAWLQLEALNLRDRLVFYRYSHWYGLQLLMDFVDVIGPFGASVHVSVSEAGRLLWDYHYYSYVNYSTDAESIDLYPLFGFSVQGACHVT